MPACRACNKYKSAKTITAFRKTLKEALSNPKTSTDFIIRVKYRDQDTDNIRFYYENSVDENTNS